MFDQNTSSLRLSAHGHKVVVLRLESDSLPISQRNDQLKRSAPPVLAEINSRNRIRRHFPVNVFEPVCQKCFRASTLNESRELVILDDELLAIQETNDNLRGRRGCLEQQCEKQMQNQHQSL